MRFRVCLKLPPFINIIQIRDKERKMWRGVHKTKGLAIDVKRLELNIHTRPQKQKRFYKRETFATLNYEIHQMYFFILLPFYYNSNN